MRGYPSWFYHSLIISFFVLVISGILLIPNALVFRLEWNVAWYFPEAVRSCVVALHVLIAFFVVSQLGSLWCIHMRIGWRHHKNIISGLSMISILLALVVTGIGIYYLGEKFSLLASVVHIMIGFCLPYLFIYHIVAGRAHNKLQ